MFRRLLALVPLLLALAFPAAAADTIDVHLRVEGKSATIFGAAEPIVHSFETPLNALEVASLGSEFYYHVTQTGFGPYVDQIGRYPADSTGGWVYKVNGVSPPVGADSPILKPGDRVLWYWATFAPGATTGPPTLELRRYAVNCYRVSSLDDAGKRAVARGAFVDFDGRTKVARTGQICIGKHRSFVRARLPGAVRSNAVR